MSEEVENRQLIVIDEAALADAEFSFYYTHSTSNTAIHPYSRAISIGRARWSTIQENFSTLLAANAGDPEFSIVLPSAFAIDKGQNKDAGLLSLHVEGTRDLQIAIESFKRSKRREEMTTHLSLKDEALGVNYSVCDTRFGVPLETKTLQARSLCSDLVKLKELKPTSQFHVSVSTTDPLYAAETLLRNARENTQRQRLYGVIKENNERAQIVDRSSGSKRYLAAGDQIEIFKIERQSSASNPVAFYYVDQKRKSGDVNHVQLGALKLVDTPSPSAVETSWKPRQVVRVVANRVGAMIYTAEGLPRQLRPGDDLRIAKASLGSEYHKFEGKFSYLNDKTLLLYDTAHPFYDVLNFIPAEDVTLMQE